MDSATTEIYSYGHPLSLRAARPVAVLGERVTHISLRARRVVGHAVDDDRDAARAIALVADFLEVVGPTLAAAALDRALGGVLGHVGIEGLVEHQPQEIGRASCRERVCQYV